MRFSLIPLGLVIAAGGCNPWQQQPVAAETVRELLPLLENGKTKRSELEPMLGSPSFESTRDRVLAYRLAPDASGRLQAVKGRGVFRWNGVLFNLVIALDENDIVQSHALIQIRESLE